MSNFNKVSAVLTDADLQKIIKALDDIQTALPFLVTFTKDEKKKLRKMGAKSVEYVNLCLQGTANFNNQLPASFDNAEFQKDVTLTNALLTISVKMGALYEGVNDTMMASGSDSMMAADEVYGALKNAAKKNASVKTLVDQIAQRYAAQSKPRKPKVVQP